MIVEKIMSKEVITLSPTDTLFDANKIMQKQKIRHLPIVDASNKLVGLVAQRDIKNTISSFLNETQEDAIYQTPIADIMIKDPMIGHPLDFIEEVALLFYEHKIGCLPIVSQHKLVGIITDTDLLYSYIELTGATQPSSRIDIRVKDEAGTLRDITNIIAEHNANILSTLIYQDDQPDLQILSIRLKSMNPLPIIQSLRKGGFDVLWPNIPGMKM
ncbi:MAG: acetoin utilization AcuB family protein [Kurthia sp.]|nr:acetoin utilization AcuB family protein [Candidatus Kurthia equi]